MKKSLLYLGLIFSVTLFSCGNDDVIQQESKESEVENTVRENETSKKPNIVLIIADDMGLDATPGYAQGAEKPQMKTLDSLRKNGIQFTNVWSNPTCSPTRAGIITGKYGFRTGVTAVDKELSTTETSLQKYITEKTNNDYSSSVIGKWHLSKDNNHPNNIGIDYYAGSISGSLKSYTDWTLNVNGYTIPFASFNITFSRKLTCRSNEY